MVTRRILALASFLLLTLQFSGTILSSPPHAMPTASAQDDTNFTLEGKITEKSAGKLTVSSGENMIFHVLYNDKTEIKKKDGSPGSGQDLRTGLRISVRVIWLKAEKSRPRRLRSKGKARKGSDE